MASWARLRRLVGRVLRGREYRTTVPSRPPIPEGMERWRMPGGGLLTVHARDRCVPPCTIHAPSDHRMRGWPLHWRQDRGIFERLCDHGIGHPDPDCLRNDAGVHGCDGCCSGARL